MADLVLIPISGEVMEHNLDRSLGERPPNPWAFNAWKRQMQALQPGAALAFADLYDQDGRQMNRFTKRTATLSCRRMVLGWLTSAIDRVDQPFFAGYPYEFSFEVGRDQTFDPPASLDEVAIWLNEAVDGLGVEPVQLRELVANAKSNKAGVFVDGAPRRAAYFDESSAPGTLVESEAVEDAPRAEPEPVTEAVERSDLAEAFEGFSRAVRDAGLVFAGANEDLPLALLAAIVTKPFAILSGLSGSGKTQVASQEWCKWLGARAPG